MSPGCLIERSAACYELPDDHPQPEEVRWRLDAVGRRLADVLGPPLDEVAAGREQEVWIVRRLAVEVALDLGDDDLELARAWADEVASALARLLGLRHAAPPGAGASGAGERFYIGDAEVVVFADRAEQLAAVVCELATGAAAQRWWHAAAFGGLFTLPAGAAVAAALLREPALGRVVLERLAREGRLEPVAATLGATGRARVLEALYPEPIPDADLRAAAGARALLAVRAPGGLPARGGSAPGKDRAAETEPPPDGSVGPGADRPPPGDTGATVANAIHRHDARRDEALSTACGGAFLLLRGLTSLGLEHVDPASRLLALRAALGADRARVSAADAVLTWIAGTEPVDEPAAFGAALLEGLLATGRTDGRSVTLEATPLGLLLRDAEHDAWLALGDVGDVQRAVDALSEAAGDAPTIVDGHPPIDAAELAYFTLPADAAAAAAIGGRALLRDLTARLAGLGSSSAEHVSENLLDRSATVRAGTGALHATLSPAPLDVVLHIAGFDGLCFEVPWVGEVELSIPR